MSLAAFEVQNGFLVTFESLLNHFSASPWSNPSLILHMAKIVAQEGGSIDIEVIIEICETVATIFAQKMLARKRRKEYQGAVQFVCSKETTLTTLIEIAYSVPQEESAKPTIEAFCKETGNVLLGRRVNEETHEMLLVVQLLQTVSASRLTTTLNQALQQGVIASFRYVTCDLVKISFDPSLNLREQMHDFPLRPGEFWFPAIHNPHQAYVGLNRPLMLKEQAAWLLRQQLEWAFV